MESNQSKYLLCYQENIWNFLIHISNNINISYINQEKSAMKDDKISTVGWEITSDFHLLHFILGLVAMDGQLH